MGTIFTDAGKEAILKSLGQQIKNNPFMRENDKTYCRFDTISIEQISWIKSGVEVFFSWKGEKMMMVGSIDNLSFKDGDSLTIAGIEGRLEIKLGD